MKIVIAGDSWGLGEWGHVNDRYQPIHAGTEHFLRVIYPQHDIINVSQAGASNMRAISRLKLQTGMDLVIYFQTDAMRELSPYTSNKTFLSLSCYDDIANLNIKLLDQAYKDLDEIGCTVLMIGGCAKLHTDLMLSYNNLVPLIPSVAEMLIPGHEQTLFPYGDYLDHIKLIFKDRSKLDELIKIGNLFKNEHKVATCKEYFYPDIHHCNRHGHEKIVAKIAGYIKEKQ